MAYWIITEDKINDGESDGRRNFDKKFEDLTPETKAKFEHKFRLLDDDGEIYFYGLSTDCNSEGAFDPVDEFGEAFGAIHIEYYDKDKKKWEVL